MGNHIPSYGKSKTVMHLSVDKKWVITETTILDKRPVSYFSKILLKHLLKEQ